MMWIYLITTFMIFAGLTSAVLVSYYDWMKLPFGWARNYDLPGIFAYSTGVVVLASATAQLGFWAAKRAKTGLSHVGLWATLVLGVVFLVLQVDGFQALIRQGIYLVGYNNPSGSFLYVIAFVHGLHLVAAVVALLIMGVNLARGLVKPGRLLGLELTITFWHALGFLWVYLFIFLSYLYN